MNASESLAARFERQRRRLHGVAYRMLGSTAEAEDAVQEAWLRLDRSDATRIEDLDAWLTTVVARVCLNQLRSRRRRREDPIDVHVPDPVVTVETGAGPEDEAVLADSVGLALLVVLETLSPAERLAFVLHDMFAVPFDEIGTMLERSPAAARQLASRARRQVQARTPRADQDRSRQREVVNAFFAAARDGDFDGLVAVLHPEAVLRSDGGTARPQQTVELAGAHTIAGQAVTFGRLYPLMRPALVNGAAGAVVVGERTPLSIMGFTVSDGQIVAIDVLVDPDRLGALDLPDAFR